MVAGKVKAAMGFQRSPATPKAADAPRRSNCSPSSNKSQAPPSSNSKVTVFSRSFGVYFPRSSVQIQPQPRSSPDVAELLRLVEELQERESRLRTELLEHKIFKETVAIIPFLEQEIASKTDELSLSTKAVELLEGENQAMRLELEGMRYRIRADECEHQRKEKRIGELEAELEEMRRLASEQSSTGDSRRICGSGAAESDDCSSSQTFQGLVDASAKSTLLKSLRKVPKTTDIVCASSNLEIQRPEVTDRKGDDVETERTHQSRCEREEVSRPRVPRVPKPPPRPSISSDSSSSSSSSSVTIAVASSRDPDLEGLPPAPVSKPGTGARPPPPPPPPPPRPAKGSRSAAACVRRVPEVVEFYHSLMRRDSRRDSGGGAPDGPATAAASSNARDMIGEIENRSAHLLAIKTDVETQGDFIRFLIKEVNDAAFTTIEDLVAFVKWLDDELSFLVDERAVLKHFDWPELKADAMREAAFGYCDMKKLESEASSFVDDPRQPCSSALKKMQALLEKLEHGVYNLSRVREGATKRYKGFQIPWEWMLENGFVSQIKLASVKLAMKYMKRVSSELEAVAGGPEVEELMRQGVRFAFRVHQFAGGFDMETMRAFQQLRDKARSLQRRNQNQHQQQKLTTRSMPC